jgi:cobalt-zinc-cadmium efflux system outer membrane protein
MIPTSPPLLRSPLWRLVAPLLACTACSAPEPAAREASPLPPAREAAPRAASGDLLAPQAAEMAVTQDLEALSLEAAVRRALGSRPELEAASRELAARLAEVQGAGRRPNPHLTLDVEDFAGSGQQSGFGGAQTTLTWGQPLERGGKRGARVEVRRLLAELASEESGLLAMDVVAEVTGAYWTALEAEGSLELARSIEEITRGFLETVRERVAGGRVSPVEEARYELAFAAAGRARREAERELQLAQRGLELSMGGTVRVTGLASRFEAISPPPPLAALQARLAESPRVTRLALDVAVSEAEADLARTRGSMDVEFSLALRRYEATDNFAAVLGLDVPLPVYHHGQDALAAARQRSLRAAAQRDAQLIDLSRELEQAWSRMSGAHAELRALEESVLEDSSWVAETVAEGYRNGKFELLDALDAQRTLYEARSQHLNALADYHLARVELENLLCESLDR